jgi:hypothetical protein
MGQFKDSDRDSDSDGVPVRLAMRELMVTLGRSLLRTESGWNSSVSWRYLCFNVFFPVYVTCYTSYLIIHFKYFILNNSS